MNIVFRIFPAATVQVALVIFFFIYCKDYETATSLATLAISIFSFVIFIRVCLPFDPYRAFLVGGLTFVAALAVVADIFSTRKLFGINYSLITMNLFWALIISLIVAGILYALLSVGASKFHKYLDKKREERIDDYF